MPVRLGWGLKAKSLSTLPPRLDFSFTASTELVGRMVLLALKVASEPRPRRRRLGAADPHQARRHLAGKVAHCAPSAPRSTTAQTEGWAWHPSPRSEERRVGKGCRS